MLLSRGAILKHIKKGNIIIDPFDGRKLKTTSYDVSLGNYFWREKHHEYAHAVHNVYDDKSVKRVWSGPFEAEPCRKISRRLMIKFANIKPADKIILLRPSETILAHTEEFIGGKNCCVSKMYARSSLGRNFIEVCKDAGWGDIGYFNRWTMEITNNSQHFAIPLVVGRRIAQMVFYEAEPVETQAYVQDKLSGKYQASDDLKILKKSWNPYLMLPKMHLDWEVKEK